MEKTSARDSELQGAIKNTRNGKCASKYKRPFPL
jgi:hypothetical protein